MIKDDLDNFLVTDGTDPIDQLLEEITRLEVQNEQLMNSLFEANREIIHWRNLNQHLQQRIDNFNEATWEPAPATPELEPSFFISMSKYFKTPEPKK